MLVYVINDNGKPLMPTHPAKARKLLKQKKAKIIKKLPFTIKLTYHAEENVQKITLGVDPGSKHIGLSATTNKKELYSADVELRNDIVDLLATRRQARRTRRNRKIRYRKPRFLNRVKSKKKGWLAPSILHKINTHINMINDIYKILPISKIIVEIANFDIQKIKNPNISGKEYQQGEQLGFWNVREYVLHRDNYICQCCKKKDKILNVHHIESRKTGGDAPNNLITLCTDCHSGYHNGTVKLPKTIKRGMKFKDTTFMNIMKNNLIERLQQIYDNIHITYGYITKHTRINNNLPKEHHIDARCITNNPTVKPSGITYYLKKIRRHNRKIFKDKIKKKGIKQRNQCPYNMFSFRRYDLIKWRNKLYYINSLRTSGSFQIKSLINNEFAKHITYKKLNLFQIHSGYIINYNQGDEKCES